MCSPLPSCSRVVETICSRTCLRPTGRSPSPALFSGAPKVTGRSPGLPRAAGWERLPGKGDAVSEGGMRIGILTGGRDSPRLNAVIRAGERKGEGGYGHNVLGFRHGWQGVIGLQTL